MCKCTPEIRTPFCGKPGCEWPEQRPSKEKVSIQQAATSGRLLRQEHATSGTAWSFEDWLTFRYERLQRELAAANRALFQAQEAAKQLAHEPASAHATAEYRKIQDFVIGRGLYREQPENKTHADIVLELADRASQPQATAREPDGYAYRYHDARGDVIRFNGGQQVNGGRPFEAVPYWLGKAPSQPPSPEWQPIETAPKDGTEIALLFPREDSFLGRTLPKVRAASWYRGAWSVPHFTGNMPTHWQFLPAAPGPCAAVPDETGGEPCS